MKLPNKVKQVHFSCATACRSFHPRPRRCSTNQKLMSPHSPTPQPTHVLLTVGTRFIHFHLCVPKISPIYYRLFNPNSSHALILKEPRLNNLAPGLPVLCFSLRSSDQVAVIVSHPGPQLEMVVVLILLCSFSERHSGAPSVQEGGLCGGGGTMYFSLNFGCGCSHVLPPPPQHQRLLHTKRIVKKTRILNSELFGSEVVQKC